MENNNGIKKAKEELDKISQDERERRLAELREKAIMDEIAIRKSGYNEGKEDGIKEGIKEGKESKALEMAKSMLKDKVDIAFIVKYTGLTEEEISKKLIDTKL